MRSIILLLVLGLSALPACSSTAESGERGSGDSGGDEGSTTTGSGAGGPACAPFQNESGRESVEVRMTNGRTTPVFVEESEFTWKPWAFVARDGATIRTDADRLCGYTSEAPGFSTTLIAPGATLTWVWSATELDHVMPPVGCFVAGSHGDDAYDDTDCDRLVAAPPGTYTFGARVMASATCLDPSTNAEGPCTCTPAGDGMCQVEQVTAVTDPIEATVEAAVPASGTVEIVLVD
jgi:hypothetical protein